MATQAQLPCDQDDVCMRCKVQVPPAECLMCVTPWHVHCLSSPQDSLASTAQWTCPDCSGDINLVPVTGSDKTGLVSAIRAIEADESLTETQKAKKRQQLVSGKSDEEEEKKNKKNGKKVVRDDVMATVAGNLTCCICTETLHEPVSTPCEHNFCLECFKRWVKEGKYTCGKCRCKFTKKAADNMRINLTLVAAIRITKVHVAPPKVIHFVSKKDLPQQAFRSERAVKNGDANATSGPI